MPLPATSSATARTAPARPRFTLRGMMFTGVLGLSIGLAYSRWPEVTFSGAMLLSFTIWLVIGLIQRVRRDLGRLEELKGASSKFRWGLVYQCIVPIWSLIVLAIVAATEMAWRYGMLASAWPRRWADILFYLAIIAAYWQPRPDHSLDLRRTRFLRALCTTVLLVLGACWGMQIIFSEAQIFRMVYSAIRKLEATQPTTWSGQPFAPTPYTVSPDLLEQILDQLSAASILLAIATAASGLMLYLWQAGTRWWLAAFAIWLTCLAAIARCLHVCWNIGPADLSPWRTAAIFDLSWPDASMLSLLMITVITASSLHFAAIETSGAKAATRREASPPLVPLYERAAVMAFGLCAIVGALAQSFWQNMEGRNSANISMWITDSSLIRITAIQLAEEYALYMPQTMIRVAAALVLARGLGRCSRGPWPASAVWSIEPYKFMAIWIVSLVTLMFAAPVAVWWGVVATLVAP